MIKLANTLGLISWKLEVQNESTESYRDTRGPGEEAFQNMLKIASEHRNEAKAIRDTAILRLLHDLALRRSSVVNLNMEDLELDRQAIWVTLKKRSEKKLKTLPKVTQEALKAWLQIKGDKEGPVFTNLDRAGKGHRLTGTGLYYLVRKYGERLGVKTRPHGIRHTAITEAVKKAHEAGIGLDEVLEFSDHKDVSTLMIYQIRKGMSKVSSAILSQIPPHRTPRTSYYSLFFYVFMFTIILVIVNIIAFNNVSYVKHLLIKHEMLRVIAKNQIQSINKSVKSTLF